MNRDELGGKTARLKGKIKQAPADLTNAPDLMTKAWQTKQRAKRSMRLAAPSEKSVRLSNISARRSRNKSSWGGFVYIDGPSRFVQGRRDCSALIQNAPSR